MFERIGLTDISLSILIGLLIVWIVFICIAVIVNNNYHLGLKLHQIKEKWIKNFKSFFQRFE